MRAEAFTPLGQEDAAYLFAQVESFERDWTLVLPYVPAEARADWLAVLAFAAEVIGAPGKVSNAMLGKIRLQWWREAMDEVFSEIPARQHPVVLALKSGMGDRSDCKDAMLSVIDGMEAFLEPGEDADLEAAIKARRPVYGALGATLSQIAGGAEPGDALVLHALCRSAPDAGALPNEDGSESPARRFSRALAKDPATEAALARKLKAVRKSGGRTMAGLPLRLFRARGDRIERIGNPLSQNTALFAGMLRARG